MSAAIETLVGTIAARGDLAHIALFAWASVASLFAAAQHRESRRRKPALRRVRARARPLQPQSFGRL